MSCRHWAKFVAIPLVVLGSFAFSSSAWAGFQWISPPSDGAPTPVVAAPTAPALGVMQDIVSPVIIGGGSVSSPSVSSVPTSPPVSLTQPTISSTVVNGDVTSRSNVGDGEIPIYNGPVPPLEPRPISAPPPSIPSSQSEVGQAAGSSTDVVHGFAKAVPVVVALRQILPSGYAFSINPSVDMGTLVSFQGGRAWRDTLRDALTPVGLDFHEQGQMVEISYPSNADKPTIKPASAYQPGAAPGYLQAPQSGAALAKPAVAIDPMPSPSIVPTIIAAGAPDDSANLTWIAERGSSLHKVISDWSQRAHVELNWLAEYDYPLDATVDFTGSFRDAVRNLLTGFEGAHPQPVAELHSNPAIGQMVLIVQARGNTNTD